MQPVFWAALFLLSILRFFNNFIILSNGEFMKQFFTSLLICLCFSLSALGQNFSGAQSLPFTIKKSAVVDASKITRKFRANLERAPFPPPGGWAYNEWLNEQKAMDSASHFPGISSAKTMGGAPDPTVGLNFEGNTYTSGIPNDNDMAISNEGKVVSVVNSDIFVFDENGTALLDITLADFSDTLGLTADKFDPKVIYDPAEDKFVICFLSGFTSATSDIVVGFSQTNDPAGLWNLYALDGDPRNYGNAFTDYPIIALTENEFFVTVNMVQEGVSWQTGFVESLVWQCSKWDGYSGDSLSTRLWYDVKYNNKNLRNLCPVRCGSGLAGNNLYLLSNRNFAASNDSIFLLEITDTMNAPGVVMNVNMYSASAPYGFAGNARQPGGKYFATNDARVLNAFIENDVIQFVGNSKDQVSLNPSVYHGVIENVSGSPVVTGFVISDSLLHYGYPNLSHAGVSAGSHESIITFNHTSVSTFAGCSAVFYDGNGNYSNRISVKDGLGYVDIPWYPGVERWGDYSGSQPRFNLLGKVWMVASFGQANHQHGTWIAEIANLIVGNEPASAPAQFEVRTWPNPAAEMVTVEFEQNEFRLTQIALYDAQGKLLKTFISDHLRPGVQQFTFSTEPLPNGIYFLNVVSGNQPLVSKRIVVQK